MKPRSAGIRPIFSFVVRKARQAIPLLGLLAALFLVAAISAQAANLGKSGNSGPRGGPGKIQDLKSCVDFLAGNIEDVKRAPHGQAVTALERALHETCGSLSDQQVSCVVESARASLTPDWIVRDCGQW